MKEIYLRVSGATYTLPGHFEVCVSILLGLLGMSVKNVGIFCMK